MQVYQQAGFKLNTYTVEDPKVMSELATWGVDDILLTKLNKR